MHDHHTARRPLAEWSELAKRLAVLAAFVEHRPRPDHQPGALYRLDRLAAGLGLHRRWFLVTERLRLRRRALRMTREDHTAAERRDLS